MEEREVEVDNATLNRWVLNYGSLLEQNFCTRKRPVGPSWQLDETYVRVKGAWKYLYRAVDKVGATVDFLLTAKRDRRAALRFLCKAIGHQKITIDKSGANTAAIESYNAEHQADIEIRQVEYLNNILEQDHGAVKRRVRPMLEFKAFWSAAVTLAGIEIMHMIRKGQLRAAGKLRPGCRPGVLSGRDRMARPPQWRGPVSTFPTRNGRPPQPTARAETRDPDSRLDWRRPAPRA